MQKDSFVNEVALDRIHRLFELAQQRTKKGDSDSRRLAKRYVKIANKISTHYKVRMPNDIRERICKKCGNVFVTGLNCTVRLASSKGYVAYKCECGAETHVFYK
ncbi:MAG: ribonuclease P [Candidatus Micrarchaeota archaeon]|nr:ribonuclease P [Candidatus Micrarchaeota archaeon]MDE1804586.1 ribonuclease P [Candidatus Micrarchaeota archaeon]MDE1846485.1 ribonuclease P [Candidatus Micrarchaeota archaeon]